MWLKASQQREITATVLYQHLIYCRTFPGFHSVAVSVPNDLSEITLNAVYNKSTGNPSNIKTFFNSFNIRMRLIFIFFYLTVHCVPLGDREIACSWKGILSFTPKSPQHHHSLTQRTFKDSLITFVFPFYFGPHYLELKTKPKNKKMTEEFAACTTF